MMKIVRSFGLGTLFVLLLFTGYAMAGYMEGPTWHSESPTHSSRLLSPSSAFIGRLVSVNPDMNEILINTYVPGLMGPEERIVPFRIAKDTSMAICFDSTKTCADGLVGNSALESLSMVDEELPNATKNVVVVGDPAHAERVVYVQVTYGE